MTTDSVRSKANHTEPSLLQRMAEVRAHVVLLRDEVDVLCTAMDAQSASGSDLISQLQDAYAALEEARLCLVPNFHVDQALDPADIAAARAVVANDSEVAHG